MSNKPNNQTEREIIESGDYSDLDKHDVDHDTYGNRSKTASWGNEDWD